MHRSDLYGSLPGFSAASETYENHFRWGRDTLGVITGAQLSGAARDAGNTPTTVLRPGLLLGQISATGLLKEYNPTGTDGSQVVHSILMSSFRMQDLDGNNTNRFVWVLAGGPIQAAKLLLLDNQARKQMRARFLFDDDLGNKFAYMGFQQEVNKAGNYTVVAADAGTLFTASAAAVFTLPALAAGLGPFGFLNLADANMGVASAAGDDIVWLNDVAADSLTFSTTSEKIGGFLRVYANAAGTKWYVEKLAGGTVTVVS